MRNDFRWKTIIAVEVSGAVHAWIMPFAARCDRSVGRAEMEFPNRDLREIGRPMFEAMTTTGPERRQTFKPLNLATPEIYLRGWLRRIPIRQIIPDSALYLAGLAHRRA